MDGLKLKIFVLGDLDTNCYVIFDEKTKKGLIIDAAYGAKEIKDFVQKEKLDILFILLTHAHFDHIGGVENFLQPFYLHREDLPLLKEASLNGSSFFGSFITVKKDPLFLEEGKPLVFNSHIVEVIHTPGHTPGSVSLRLGNWLFSGDTIFFNSIGRTDIPLASQESLLKSIKGKILTLPDDTIIYPGHGPSTTVEHERKFNPFLI